MKSIKIFPLQKPIKATITVPASKSYTNRALFLASITQNNVKIINPLISSDTKTMIDCLSTLGIKILRKDDFLEVTNDITSIKDCFYELNAGLSGTTMRFMLALLTIVPGIKVLRGKKELNRRPIGILVEGLRQLGAKIEYLEKKNYPPIRISSSKLFPGTIRMNGEISSQYFSAIFMIAPLIGKITIETINRQISKSYIDITIDVMKSFGVTVLNKAYKKYIISDNQKYNASKYTIESDISSASYFFAIAALTKSSLTLENIKHNSLQGDINFLKILAKMGNKITYENNKIKITGQGVQSLKINMENCPDQIQTLAVLASFTKGKTEISGIKSLRVKETERVVAIEQELIKMGIKTHSTVDTLTIYGGSPISAKINTYKDHRMAMSFAVAGTKISGMEIEDPAVVNKTFPDFWEKLNSIGIKTELIRKNIVFIGMRGSGKTTVAQLISQKLKKECLDVDKILIKKINLSIPKIIAQYGWKYFRNEEVKIIKNVAKYQNKIISTGGGVILRKENIKALRENGMIVFLKASAKKLHQRIKNSSNRPSLINNKTKKEELEELLIQRKAVYQKIADITIETDNLTVDEVVNQVMLKLKEKSI